MKPHSQMATLVLCGAIFFALGMVASALGPILPDLATHTHTDLQALGGVFTALFLGALLAQMAVGPLIDRLGQRPVLLAGLLVMGIGALGMAFLPGLWPVLLCAWITGVGTGAADVSTTVLISVAFARRNVSALNLLNAVFGAGAVAGPALAAAVWRATGSGLPVLWVVAALGIILIPLVIRVVPSFRSELRPAGEAPPASVYRSAALWMLGLFLLLYVGTENGLGGWSTEYMVQTAGMGRDRAALVTSGFWLALTVGRMVIAVAGVRLSSFTVLWLSLGGASAGGVMLTLGTGQAGLTLASILLIGFSFGAIYPTTMALATDAFPQGPGKAASAVAAMGSLGGTLLPFMQGVALGQWGPRAWALFCLAACAGMLGLYALIRLWQGKRVQPTNS